MKSIWKYPIRPDDIVKLEMPKYANILTVQMQHGTPCIWAMVDTEAEKEERNFIIYGRCRTAQCDRQNRRLYGAS